MKKRILSVIIALTMLASLTSALGGGAIATDEYSGVKVDINFELGKDAYDASTIIFMTYADTCGAWETVDWDKSIVPLTNPKVYSRYRNNQSKVALSEGYASIKFKVPAAGKYDVSLLYSGHSSNGIMSTYIAPLSATDYRDAQYLIDTSSYYVAEGFQIGLSKELGVIEVAEAGEYVVSFVGAGVGEGGNRYMRPGNLILDGLKDGSSPIDSVSLALDANQIEVGAGTVATTVSGKLTDGSALNLSEATVVYTSSDTSIATVDEATGSVTPVAPGNVTIKAEVTYKSVIRFASAPLTVKASSTIPGAGTSVSVNFEYGKDAYAQSTCIYMTYADTFGCWETVGYDSTVINENYPTHWRNNQSTMAISEGWVAMKFKVHKTGGYAVSLNYTGDASNGRANIYLAPITASDYRDAQYLMKTASFYNATFNKNMTMDIGEINVETAGEYVIAFECAGAGDGNGNGTNTYIRPNVLILDGGTGEVEPLPDAGITMSYDFEAGKGNVTNDDCILMNYGNTGGVWQAAWWDTAFYSSTYFGRFRNNQNTLSISGEGVGTGVALRVKVPRAGHYTASLVHNTITAGGIGKVYLVPSTETHISRWKDERYLAGTVDYSSTSAWAAGEAVPHTTTSLGEIDFYAPGECIIYFEYQGVGVSNGKYMYPRALILDGGADVHDKTTLSAGYNNVDLKTGIDAYTDSDCRTITYADTGDVWAMSRYDTAFNSLAGPTTRIRNNQSCLAIGATAAGQWVTVKTHVPKSGLYSFSVTNSCNYAGGKYDVYLAPASETYPERQRLAEYRVGEINGYSEESVKSTFSFGDKILDKGDYYVTFVATEAVNGTYMYMCPELLTFEGRPDLESISLTAEADTVYVADTIGTSLAGVMSDELALSDCIEYADVSYESLTPDIATVTADGKITGVAVGNAEIKVTVGFKDVTKTASVNVTVNQIELQASDLEVVIGDVNYTGAAVEPDDISIIYNGERVDNVSGVYSSNVNPGIATAELTVNGKYSAAVTANYNIALNANELAVSRHTGDGPAGLYKLIFTYPGSEISYELLYDESSEEYIGAFGKSVDDASLYITQEVGIPKAITYGLLSENEVVATLDAVIAQRIYNAGGTISNPYQMIQGDVDTSGGIDLVDAQAILNNYVFGATLPIIG